MAPLCLMGFSAQMTTTRALRTGKHQAIAGRGWRGCLQHTASRSTIRKAPASSTSHHIRFCPTPASASNMETISETNSSSSAQAEQNGEQQQQEGKTSGTGGHSTDTNSSAVKQKVPEGTQYISGPASSVATRRRIAAMPPGFFPRLPMPLSEQRQNSVDM